MQKNLRILAALSLAEGVLTFVWLLSFPTNRQTFSLLRLSALAIILALSFIFAGVLIFLRSPKELPILAWITDLKGRLPFAFSLIATALLLWAAILFKGQWLAYVSESTYARLVPILIYAMLLCLQTGTLFLLLGHNRDVYETVKRVWKPTLVLWGVFLATWFLVSISRIGLIHDVVGLSWGPPGTPITFAQVNLVLVIGFLSIFGLLLLGSRLPNVASLLFRARDIIFFLGLWSLAVLVWWQQPMSPTHFTPPPMPPNNEYYPHSDALIFDRTSYHLLYGTGFTNQLARRPLYVGLLAFFHWVAGPNYDDTILLQILLLGLIPALVFLLTSRLSNRLSGLLAGGLIILREKNAIELSGEIVTSHAKLMMSDMVTLLGVLLFVYVTVRFLFRENRSNWEPGILGACLGLVALIRAQVLILAVPLILFIFLSKRSLKLGLKASILTLLGLALVMAPWIWRNWNLTGTFVLDDRGEESLLARNYSSSPSSFPFPRAGETQEGFSDRLRRDILTFVVTHPRDVLFFVSNHFLRNLLTSALFIAPAYSVDSPATLIEHLPFWGAWDGHLTPASGISLALNLMWIAAGISAAGRKNKQAGWFPFVAFLVYSLGNALVRSSGWRFSLPVDWIIIVYYSIGLAYLPSKIGLLFREYPRAEAEREEAFRPGTTPRALVFVLLLLLGAAIPIAERLIPARSYDRFTDNARLNLSEDQVAAADEINRFLEQKDAVLLSGIALYPRYVRPNSRISVAGAPEDAKFLYFWLINESNQQVILPLQDSPEGIPHTATISVIGCREEYFISAFAVIVQEPSKQILVRDPKSPLRCPLVWEH